MSLINNMLRDLDKRRASDAERSSVPNEVRPLPPEAPRKRSLVPVLAALGVAAATAAWFLLPPSLLPQKVGAGETAIPAAVPVPAVVAAAPAAPLAPTAPPAPPAPPVPAVAAGSESPLPAAAPMPALVPVVAAPSASAPPVAPAPSPSAPIAAEPPKADIFKAAPTIVAAPATAPTAKAAVTAKTGTEKPARTDVAVGNLRLDSRLTLPAKKSTASPAEPATPAAVSAPTPTKAADTAESEIRLAEGLLRQGHAKEAEARLQRVLVHAPDHIAGRQALLNLLLTAKRTDDAALVLQEGLNRHPAQSQWAMNLARLQVDRNDYAKAWETLARSLPQAQQQPEYRAFCGTVLQRLNRPREAAEHYRAALTAKPAEGRWWVGFALVLEAERQLPEAREAYQRARQTGSLPPELAAFVDQKLR